MRLELPRSLDQLRYYGRGPQKNYSDRHTAALLGTYQDSVRRTFPGGVGGDNSWGALPHDQYRLLAKQYSYSYTLRLVDEKTLQQ